jgi:hemolysin-activating ACP:hemolysin acyltransferase
VLLWGQKPESELSEEEEETVGGIVLLWGQKPESELSEEEEETVGGVVLLWGQKPESELSAEEEETVGGVVLLWSQKPESELSAEVRVEQRVVRNTAIVRLKYRRLKFIYIFRSATVKCTDTSNTASSIH